MMLTTAVWMALAIPALAAPKPCGKKVHLGPRPFWLIEQMKDSPLKKKLESCTEMDMKSTAWSISHRGGGTLQFPEETYDSIMAGTRMGAGIQECDVVFTKDKTLVCRHAQCDLHTTTNVVTTALNAKCTTPFTPYNKTSGAAATAKCCTSDFTATEISTLCSKMDGFNPNATTAKDYLDGTSKFRTDLYAKTCAKVLTLKQYIAIVDGLGLKFTPELKTPEVPMPFPNGSTYTQEKYAQQMIDEFKAAKIAPDRVYAQSFLYADILYWLKAEPAFGQQAVLLDESADFGPMDASVANLTRYAKEGVKIVAPPLPYLVTVGKDGDIVPSAYAIKAKELGLKIITWSLERSGWLSDETHGGYYYDSIGKVVNNEGDVFRLLHVLAQQVGVIGVFSDWSATVTYYANCFGLVF